MNLSLNQNQNFSNQRIIDCALSWVGTPFKKHGRIKNIGVDCIGLILGVLEEIKHPIREKIQDKQNYNFDERSESLNEILKINFITENKMNAPSIALMEYRGGYQHLGIIIELNAEEFGMVHADISAKKVVIQRLDSVMKKRIKAKYKF